MNAVKAHRIGSDSGIEAAFFKAGTKEGMADPLHDPGIIYVKDLVYRICANPDYVMMDKWPASTVVHSRWIEDTPIDPGVLGDNLLWCYGTQKEWLLRVYKELGDEERDARWNILSSIKTLFLESEEELFRTSRHHVANEMPRYACVLEGAYPLFNDNVRSSLTRLQEIEIEREFDKLTGEGLFQKIVQSGQ